MVILILFSTSLRIGYVENYLNSIMHELRIYF
jgi:hypothetical protein